MYPTLTDPHHTCTSSHSNAQLSTDSLVSFGSRTWHQSSKYTSIYKDLSMCIKKWVEHVSIAEDTRLAFKQEKAVSIAEDTRLAQSKRRP